MSERPHPTRSTPQLEQGRGSPINPPSRFERIVWEPDPECPPEEGAAETVFFDDPTRQILSTNDSPDVPFKTSVNPYRGCEHGCSYCFARPTHEYLGYSAGLDFETRIMVKRNAPALLRSELAAKRWEPQVVVMSGVTDPYQPIEKKLEITRGCLSVLAEARNPVGVITKNHLVTRDIDHLAELASHQAARVYLSITTLDPALANRMEPRASTPERRLDAVRQLTDAGIPVGVMVAPVVPGITDHEMPRILEAAAEAGACSAGFVILRLPWSVGPVFEAWLDMHFPDRKEKVLNRVRSMRDGKLYDSRWKHRQRGEGVFAEQIGALFRTSVRRFGLDRPETPWSTAAFRKPPGDQLSLFGG